MRSIVSTFHGQIAGSCLVFVGLAVGAGCESSLGGIDRRVDRLLAEQSAALGPDALAPSSATFPGPPGQGAYSGSDVAAERLPTVNPAADELPYSTADEEPDQVLKRLEGYAEETADAMAMDLTAALGYAMRHSREYRFAEEEYVLDALRLLIERHLWGPRFFNDLTASVEGVGDDGTFDTALRLVNELRVTQRLPYGGAASARFLTEAVEDLHQRVAGENVQTADIILAADVPLLRGAGLIAREDLIQAERNLIYAARDFERFRRQFLFNIAQDFLGLVVQLQAIGNAEERVDNFVEAERRAEALVDAGRVPPFDAALAAQDTRDALDTLNRQRETYRLSVDRFRVRIGMPDDEPFVIIPSSPGLPLPAFDMVAAVRAALTYRLDLQNRRDRLDDTQRTVDNAFNALLPDLNLSGSLTLPTDDDLDFEPGDTSFLASVTFGLPLDREIERLNVRQAQIDRERSIRDYEEFRDSVAVDARSAVRDIDRAKFSVRLQEENIAIANHRRASIDAAPDRADARERSETVDALNRARNRYDNAQRDLQVGILRYLLDTGQLRVDSQGLIKPLAGMEIAVEPGDEDERPAPPPPSSGDDAPGAVHEEPPPPPVNTRN